MKKKTILSWFRKFLKNHADDFDSLPEAPAAKTVENPNNRAVTSKKEKENGKIPQSGGVSEETATDSQENSGVADKKGNASEKVSRKMEDDGIPHFTGCSPKPRSLDDDIFIMAREA